MESKKVKMSLPKNCEGGKYVDKFKELLKNKL